MAEYIPPSKRISQPKQFVEIDWSNPITNGLVEVITPSLSRSVVSKIIPTTTGTVTTSFGRDGVNFTTTNNVATTYKEYAGTFSQISGPFTFLLLYNFTSTSSFSASARVAGNFTAATSGYEIAPSTTNFRALFSSATTTTSLTGSVLSTGRKVDVLKYDGTTGYYYENGKLSASAAGAYVAPTTNFRIGADNGTGVTTPANVYLAVLFNRSLSDAEIRELTNNPWLVFKPQAKTYYQAVDTRFSTNSFCSSTSSGSLSTATRFAAAPSTTTNYTNSASIGNNIIDGKVINTGPYADSATVVGNTINVVASGNLSTGIPFSASVSAQATVPSTLLITPQPLNAFALASASITASINTLISLATNASASALTGADLFTQIFAFTSSFATATASANLTTPINLQSSAFASASTSSNISTQILTSTNSFVVASASSNLTTNINLATSAIAVAASLSNITTGIPLQATAISVTTSASNITTQDLLGSTVFAIASTSSDLITNIRLQCNTFGLASTSSTLSTQILDYAAVASVANIVTANLSTGISIQTTAISSATTIANINNNILLNTPLYHISLFDNNSSINNGSINSKRINYAPYTENIVFTGVSALSIAILRPSIDLSANVIANCSIKKSTITTKILFNTNVHITSYSQLYNYTLLNAKVSGNAQTVSDVTTQILMQTLNPLPVIIINSQSTLNTTTFGGNPSNAYITPVPYVYAGQFTLNSGTFNAPISTKIIPYSASNALASGSISTQIPLASNVFAQSNTVSDLITQIQTFASAIAVSNIASSDLSTGVYITGTSISTSSSNNPNSSANLISTNGVDYLGANTTDTIKTDNNNSIAYYIYNGVGSSNSNTVATGEVLISIGLTGNSTSISTCSTETYYIAEYASTVVLHIVATAGVKYLYNSFGNSLSLNTAYATQNYNTVIVGTSSSVATSTGTTLGYYSGIGYGLSSYTLNGNSGATTSVVGLSSSIATSTGTTSGYYSSIGNSQSTNIGTGLSNYNTTSLGASSSISTISGITSAYYSGIGNSLTTSTGYSFNSNFYQLNGSSNSSTTLNGVGRFSIDINGNSTTTSLGSGSLLQYINYNGNVISFASATSSTNYITNLNGFVSYSFNNSLGAGRFLYNLDGYSSSSTSLIGNLYAGINVNGYSTTTSIGYGVSSPIYIGSGYSLSVVTNFMGYMDARTLQDGLCFNTSRAFTLQNNLIASFAGSSTSTSFVYLYPSYTIFATGNTFSNSYARGNFTGRYLLSGLSYSTASSSSIIKVVGFSTASDALYINSLLTTRPNLTIQPTQQSLLVPLDSKNFF